MLIVWILIWFVVAVAVWLIFWLLINFVSGKSHWQAKFVEGRIPDPAPDGFYRGSAYLIPVRRVPWLGKSFELKNDLGFNIFNSTGASLLKILTPLYKKFRMNDETNTEAYYFKTSISSGFKDKSIETFKLDYDSPENPFLIRLILDEIVEVGPQEFLGKVHLKVFPGYYSTIGFFGLKR